jgi:MoxR-like ATPase
MCCSRACRAWPRRLPWTRWRVRSAGVSPHPVHARPAAGGPDRDADLQPRDATFSAEEGADLREHVLADEINRAPAKVQSALLEAMQERQVTLGEETFPARRSVPRAGDAEPDRAGGHLSAARGAGRPLHAQAAVDYPTREEERAILDRMATTAARRLSAVIGVDDRCWPPRKVVDEIYIDDKVKDYIVALVHATRARDLPDRRCGWIEYGASPRATILADARREGLGVPAGPGLRHAAGCEVIGPTCCATA